MAVVIRILGSQVPCDYAEVRGGLLTRNAGPQPADESQHVQSALSRHRLTARRVVAVVSERGPQLRSGSLNRKLESARHHADDAIALVVQCNRASDDCRIGAEDRAPQ